MFGRSLARALLTSTAIAGTCLTVPAWAQLTVDAPVRPSIDENGVDLLTGTINIDGPELSAGQRGGPGLVWKKIVRKGKIGDNLSATLSEVGSTLVSFGGKTDRFFFSGGVYVPSEKNGSTLTLSGSIYTYTTSDGTVIRFSREKAGHHSANNIQGVAMDVTFPSGEKLEYTHESMYYCVEPDPWNPMGGCAQNSNTYRLSTIQSNLGYRITYDNAAVYTDPNDYYSTDWMSWGTTYGVSLTNTTIAGASVRSQTFAESLGAGVEHTITDPMGGVTVFRTINNILVGVKRPGASSEDFTIAYDGSNRVSSITTPAGSTTYAYANLGGNQTTTVTNPAAQTITYVFDGASQRMASRTDAMGRTTAWTYDGNGRLTRTTYPETNYTEHSYDDRGNVTQTRFSAKSGSGLADTTVTAGYDATCANAVTCNSPNWTRDAAGNQTDYSYNAGTGQIASVTAPAATSGAARPTTSFTYTAVSGVQMIASVSVCSAGSSCAGTAAELKTSYSYNANGLPTSITRAAGDNSVSAALTFTYDDVGNVASIDGPLAGSDDTSRFKHDANRRLTASMEPDPDGAGVRKTRATQYTYNADSQVTAATQGTVPSQAANWSGFVADQTVQTGYDASGRVISETVVAGGAAQVARQYSYDTAGRLDCTAIRMNPAALGSLPGSACSLGTEGSYGPDRITKLDYNASGQVTKSTSAYGTTAQSADVTATFTNNGKVASLTDAEGNRTERAYDGFDRLVKTSYPVTTKGAGTSSSSDYEQFGYDVNGNITSRRLRDGTTIAYGYDLLGRLVSKDVPNTAYNDLDVAYEYDLLGRLTKAAGGSVTLNEFGYDALGRLVTDKKTHATTSYAYDAAGRRTRTTWNDGFYVDYVYDVTGKVTAIRENGATSGIGVLASYAYDDLGRRTSLTRGNGVVTGYSYDALSRLSVLSLNLAGSPQDESVTFGYNPAGQIISRTGTNDAYAWSGAVNVDRPYAANGLNQYSSAGAASFGYDGRGNLNSSNGTTYTYTAENLLAQTSDGASLSYEPGGGELFQLAKGGVDRRFVTSAGQIVSEINASTGQLTARHVFGPGADEPLVSYDAGGNRSWLVADERGSIVARTDVSGGASAIAAYDEYGIPSGGDVGRFGYTGQAWLPELGLSYYKARLYSPTLGRFMQTDPIGYGDGMNMYNYTGGDPVNRIDPSGQQFCFFTTSGRNTVTGSEDDVIVNNAQIKEVCIDTGGWGSNAVGGSSAGAAPGTASPLDGKCAAPPISPAEAEASRRGDRKAFWRSREARGDPLGATGSSIVGSSNFSGAFANSRLRGAIFARNRAEGAPLSYSAAQVEVEQIGVELMRAHVNAVNTFGDPSASQIAAYHFQVFRAHRLPDSTFGGSMFTGSEAEAFATQPLWMGCK